MRYLTPENVNIKKRLLRFVCGVTVTLTTIKGCYLESLMDVGSKFSTFTKKLAALT